MKKIVLLLTSICFTVVLQAQVYETVDVTTPGTLFSNIQDIYVTNLTVKGTIDARDFQRLSNCSELQVLDLSNVTIVAYTGTDGCQPGNLGVITYPADEIPEYATYNWSSIMGTNNTVQPYVIQSIVLPTNIISIGYMAFANCINLTYLNIPTSVTSINDKALVGCLNLTTLDISLPTSFPSINLSGCNNLTSVNVSSSVTTMIISGSFTSYTVPSSVTSITFVGMNNLTSVNFESPSSVDTIGFYSTGLISVVLPSSVKSISAFQSCPNLSSVTIPSSIKKLEDDLFKGCTSLKNITLPSSLDSIGWNCFKNCTALKAINLPNQLKYIAPYAFYGSGLTSLTIPQEITILEDYSFANCSSLSFLVLPSNLNKIGAYVFSNDTSLISLTIPTSNTVIGVHFLEGCTNLKNIYSYSSNPSHLTYSGILEFDGLNECTLFVSIGDSLTYNSDWYELPKNIQIQEMSGFLLSDTIKTLSKYTSVGIDSIGITSNVTFNVSSNQPWLTISPSSSKGIEEIKFTCTQNNGATRTAIVTVASLGLPSKTITITQPTYTPIIALYSKTLSLNNVASTDSYINCASNVKLTATSDQSWLTVSYNEFPPIDGFYIYNNGDSLLNNITIDFNAMENLSASFRTAKVTVSATGVTSQIIIVTQSAGTATPVTNISVTSASVTATANSTAIVTVTSNTNWTASTTNSWLTVTQSVSTGNGTVTIKTNEANPTTVARTATVTITTASGSQTITVTQAAGTGTPVVEVGNETIVIYPNPTSSSFAITNEGIAKVEIFSSNGMLVKSTTISGKESISVSGLSAGMYVVKVIKDNEVTSRSLIVE